MKSRTSFCNPTVLKKDLTRYLPLWLIYLIFGLLILSTFIGSYVYSYGRFVKNWMSFFMPFFCMGYGLLAALNLFGDLFKPRLCNALHAMPLRRECWFFTHYLAGLLLFAGPNFLLMLVMMPNLSNLWYVALLWFGGSMLLYLFFFSLAVLCVMATANKLAVWLVYFLVNFVSLELMWVTSEFILPFLDGVQINTTPWYLFCPLIRTLGSDYFVLGNNGQTAFFSSWGDGWVYLAVLAVIGIAFAAGALALYRRRQLEVAGDFAAIAPTRYLVSVAGSLLCGMIFRLFDNGDDTLGIILLFIGVSVGFFLIQMLLQRRIKVIDRPTLIKWGCLILVLVLFLVGSALDVFGIAGYIPEPGAVESVVIANFQLDNDDLEVLDAGGTLYYYNDDYTYAILTDDADIQAVIQAHSLAIEEHQSGYSSSTSVLTIHYRLKSGATLTRVYRVPTGGRAWAVLAPWL